ncbi:MAG: RnfABCDGE type electron transport complex subunit D [Candidatus Omnitrophota bacterium]|nr:RnfABCDGE type electron transport complex subunit D [Candidatus Omnitrophota bacterium]
MVNLKSIKTQLIIFLCGFAIYLSFKDKDAIFLLTTFISVISAIGVESAILYLKNKRVSVTDSSIISGLIIGYVLSIGNAWWIFTVASLFAICFKYLIRVNGKHLFNPAAFGIFLTTVLFGVTTQWKGTYIWYVLVPFGFYFIAKSKKMELLLGYGLTALILFSVQASIQKIPISNIFGYLSYFYIFIMLIEPKTTPVKPLGKLIFGVGAAILIFILTEIGVRFDVELCALLIFNLATPLLNRLPNFRK